MKVQRKPLVMIVAALASLVLSVAAAARELTLEGAIEIAQQESYRLRAARQGLEMAAGGVRAATAAYLPALSVSASTSRLSGEVFFARFINPANPGQPVPDAPGTDVGPYDKTDMALLELSQPLYTGGASKARLEAGRVEERLAAQDLAKEQIDVTYEVTQAYYAVLLAERSVKVAEESVHRSEQGLDAVERRFAAQEALRVEVLGAESQLAADRHALAEAEENARLARLDLGRLLGDDQPADLSLTDTLEQAESTISEQAALSSAEAGNPQLQRARLQVELADAGIAGARSHYKPKLELQGLYSWVDNELFFDGTYYGVALNLSIPFLRDFRAGAGSVGQAEARKGFEENALQEVTSAVRLAARRAVQQLSQAYRAIGVAEQNLEYYRERHRVTQRAFEEQLATFNDVLDDHAKLSEAELNLYRAHYGARLAEAELRRIVGE